MLTAADDTQARPTGCSEGFFRACDCGRFDHVVFRQCARPHAGPDLTPDGTCVGQQWFDEGL